MKKHKITIIGMHCASCAGNVEKSLKKIPGVRNVSVSVITHKGIVESDDQVSEETLLLAVKRAGYKVVASEVS